jgi:hypothetical protein
MMMVCEGKDGVDVETEDEFLGAVALRVFRQQYYIALLLITGVQIVITVFVSSLIINIVVTIPL